MCLCACVCTSETSSPTDIAGQGSFCKQKLEKNSGTNGEFKLGISLAILIADTGNSCIRQLHFATEVEAHQEAKISNVTTSSPNNPLCCKICKSLLQLRQPHRARETVSVVNVSTIQLRTTKYIERDIYRISGVSYAEDLGQYFIADQGQASVRSLKREHPDDLQSLHFSVSHLEGCSNLVADVESGGAGALPKISFIPRPQIEFPSPTCICAEAAGHWLYVGDSEYESIKKVTKDGVSVWDLTRPMSIKEARDIVDGMCC
mmetsp:Transcript_20003/g.28154  ORF Transcript_20003/g.28154 Transcript_20003/m.28154 type:complete len:261 (-) Transcript_20003:47-829(-)